MVEELNKDNLYIKYEKELNNIIDIEKYHKYIGINKLQPFQLYRLLESYISIKNLLKISKNIFRNKCY